MNKLTAENQWPLVTVVTLCYNTGKFVVEALDSVLNQDYPNIQHIIIDDCSGDDSVELVEAWIIQKNYPCQFIKHTINRGVHRTLEEAVSLSNGKYWMAVSDDLITNNKLREQVLQLEELGDTYALVYGDSQTVDINGNLLATSTTKHLLGPDASAPSGDIFKIVLKHFYFYIQASILRTKYLKDIPNAFDKNIVSEDWYWQLHLARDYKIAGSDTVYAKYRRRENSVTSEYWHKKKYSLVQKSHIEMLLSFYQHPKNTNDERLIIREHFWKKLMQIDETVLENRIMVQDLIRQFYKTTKSNVSILVNLIVRGFGRPGIKLIRQFVKIKFGTTSF